MNESRNLPEVKYVTALKPVEIDGRLTYPNLSSQIGTSALHQADRWSEFELARRGGIDEESFARDLASHYLLESARKLIDANSDDSKKLWTERYNQAAVELFGDINTDDLGLLAASEVDELSKYDDDGEVSAIYKKIAGGVYAETALNLDNLQEVKEAILDKAKFVVDIIDQLPDGPYKMSTVRRVFRDAIRELKSDNPKWGRIKVVNPEDGKTISVSWVDGEIKIPDGRVPIKSKDELLGLVLHELVWHAGRSVNGATISGDDESKLATEQMPNYLEFEEGTGKLFETLIAGKMSDVAVDRYVDTAIALGLVNGVQMDRKELINFAVKRNAIRCRARGVEFDEREARSTATANINRIFRGSDGKAVRSVTGEIDNQAVFTKDILYYSGMKKAARYFEAKLAEGVDASELLDFLLSGKFDPTNEKHLIYIKTNYDIQL